MTALEAMSDLYRTLPEEAAADWLSDSRKGPKGRWQEERRNPWESSRNSENPPQSPFFKGGGKFPLLAKSVPD